MAEQIDYSKHIRREATIADQAAEAMAQGDDVAVRADMAGEVVPQPSGMVETIKRLFGGDRVLWVIIIALMTISVLVVYSSTAKMAYMPSSGSSTTEFLRRNLAPGLYLSSSTETEVTNTIFAFGKRDLRRLSILGMLYL